MRARHQRYSFALIRFVLLFLLFREQKETRRGCKYRLTIEDSEMFVSQLNKKSGLVASIATLAVRSFFLLSNPPGSLSTLTC